MFRHKNNPTDKTNVSDKKETDKAEPASVAGAGGKEYWRELLEKNLKWSQIIYEQNRKINRRLNWMVAGSWLKLLIILAPILLAAWFLPPLIKQYSEVYSSLLNTGTQAGTSQSLDQILKILPLNSAQQEQIKTMLK